MKTNFSRRYKKPRVIPPNNLNKLPEVKTTIRSWWALFVFCLPLSVFSQNLGGASVHGNLQWDAQYYFPDSAIGAENVPEKLLSNGFANFIYDNGHFSAGLRYENYLNPMLGFDPRYKGNGIPYRFVGYKNEELEITAGNFYDQFGSGLVFRTYEDRGLGYDNAMDGLRVKYTPVAGLSFKGVMGYQRDFFTKGEGIVRGADAEWSLNESIEGWDTKKTTYRLGASFVSKFQEDQDPLYKLPQNVGSGAGRITVTHGNLTLYGEYAQKINDPSATNGYIYKNGSATFLTATYSSKGIGFTLAAKRIDNMSYRSDRTAGGNSLIINYLPATTKNHTYLLAALYPYATQPNGEYGFQGEFFYHLDKGSWLGGTYGSDLTINYSRAQAIDTTQTGDDLGYTSDFLTLGKEVYFEDLNLEFHHRFSKKLTGNFTAIYQRYNKNVIQGRSGFRDIHSVIAIAELSYKFDSKHNLRGELQHLYTKQDQQNWAVLLLEYTVSPHWFFAAFDQYNYGNDIPEARFHYYTGTLGYIRGANRIQFGYGRQRAGIFCVGGVCRNVPASNGFSMTITSSF